ncbi:MAG: hypothetical protein Q8Q88_02230 [Phenylobacterium sp.]|uniref:hypothetical protein n=1 Tax=Phenylobacterium sp. TaxID=1871053 RepID=UPI002735E15E|nr:hypothetical protein [Phenylobacterium sp.]MDP3745842.1 hypothetical protein [Phenylobacterium sp.]
MKFTVLAASSVLAALIAAPASAADIRVSSAPTPVVRIALAGKSDAQISAEIKAAATTVCGQAASDCAAAAIRDANTQLASINRAHARAANAAQRIDVVRDDPKSVRVPVTGRSLVQINTDIDAAAKAVCKGQAGTAYRSCVTGATRSAKAQLQQMAQTPRPAQVASR